MLLLLGRLAGWQPQVGLEGSDRFGAFAAIAVALRRPVALPLASVASIPGHALLAQNGRGLERLFNIDGYRPMGSERSRRPWRRRGCRPRLVPSTREEAERDE